MNKFLKLSLAERKLIYRDVSVSIIEKCEGTLDLLWQVIEFKKKFYSCTWADYDSIYEGKLKLIPSRDGVKAFGDDYVEMKDMLFAKKPTFEQIISKLSEFETLIKEKIKDFNSK